MNSSHTLNHALKPKSVAQPECSACEESENSIEKNPDHTSALARLKKIKGQINGIEKMIEDQRYCVDILIQFRAVSAALSSIEMAIFRKHVESCVRGAFESKNKTKVKEKIDELIDLVQKRV